MKKVVLASLLAIASSAVCLQPAALAQDQGSQSSQITIKDPAEYTAYTSAIGQSTPAAKAAAIESFLQQYPNSVVKADLLQQLVGSYQATGDTAKTLDAAKRLLQVDPNNLRALFVVAFVEKAQANGDQAKLDDAAASAQRGLSATKPPSVDQADFDKLKNAVTPTFYSAIAADDVAKKDYKDAIDALNSELKSEPPAQTTQQPSLADVYYLGNAYVQEDPKDLVNGIWFLARAAQYLPEPYKTNAEKAAEYWYNKYHGGMDGFEQIKQLARDNVFPPSSYSPVAAPPPPSPQKLAHDALVSTPDPAKLNLSDKEYILANGSPEDAQKVWSVLQGQTTEVPGIVIQATPDSVQLAVSDDAKQSQKADFTVNLKASLKEVPTAGTQVTYIATFDSYTQNPPMIILKDGEPKAAPKPAVHHPAHRPAKSQ
jgi:tetratricopeptide (TPR) repeat protein